MKCILLGGSGYVGLRLAEKLLLEQDTVLLVDRVPPDPTALHELCSRLAAASAAKKEQASASKPSHVNKSSSSSDDDDSYGIRSLCSCSSGAALSSLPSNSDVSSQGEGSSTEQTMQLAPGLHFAAAELRVKRALVAVCAGADVVFHLASAGMSGEDSLQEAQFMFDVNVKGTLNVIAACVECHVPHLIYVSTVNVCFDHKAKVSLDEDTAPYVQHHNFWDTYSLTKSWAEQLVLSSDGTPLHTQLGQASSSVLRTCALRPPGIWGPGELRHTPRILNAARRGLLLITFGEDALSDWIHADNLADALLLSLASLMSEHPVAAGKAYFVSDGVPSNNFTFFGHFLRGLGYKMPRMRLPWRIVLGLSIANELLHLALCPLGLRIPLLLTSAEVYKTSVPHYFKIDKAAADLGYTPKAYSVQEAVDWYAQRGFAQQSVVADDAQTDDVSLPVPSPSHHASAATQQEREGTRELSAFDKALAGLSAVVFVSAWVAVIVTVVDVWMGRGEAEL